jgi:hypothetical protein
MRRQVRFDADAANLPDGAFVVSPAAEHLPMLLWQGRLWHLSLADECYYDAGLPPQRVTVLTPRPIVETLSAGYRPMIAELPGAGTRR